jgi:hypothetical protein
LEGKLARALSIVTVLPLAIKGPWNSIPWRPIDWRRPASRYPRAAAPVALVAVVQLPGDSSRSSLASCSPWIAAHDFAREGRANVLHSQLSFYLIAAATIKKSDSVIANFHQPAVRRLFQAAGKLAHGTERRDEEPVAMASVEIA